MNILLVGSGGREHALAWKICQSKQCTQLYIAPGNAGTALCGKNIDLSPNDFDAIKDFTIKHQVHMVVVGPEDPLVNGIHDYFLSNDKLKNIPVIGPQKEGAQLEGSKDFAKKFMLQHNIPTARYNTFNQDSLNKGLAYLDTLSPPYVIKADGLAAGKGVLICQTLEDANQELKAMLVDSKFGKAGNKVVIEEFLSGIEFSIFTLTDGESYKILPTAKDYKRVGEGDTGLNTGGMGAVSPVPFVDDALMQKVEDRIIKQTIKGLKSDGIEYKGFLYFGLIKVNNDPYVIEYNVRLGDPEAEAVIPRIQNDIIDLFIGVANNTLDQQEIKIDPRAAATIILTSGGYPQNYEKGKVISGLDKTKDIIAFHAGTKSSDDNILTNGGRVLALTSYGLTISEALENCYKNAEKISFEKKYYRKDIGFDLINKSIKV